MVSRMSKRILRLLLVVALALGLAGCPLNQNQTIINRYENGLSTNEQVNKVYEILNENYYQKIPLNLARIDSLDEFFDYVDPYTFLFEGGTKQIEIGDSYYGIGLTLQDHSDGLFIKEINYGVNLDTDIFVGDIIFSVEDVTLKDLEFADKVELLKKGPGTRINLRLIRFKRLISATVEIVEVPYQSVVYKNDNGVGVIKINRFAEKTPSLFKSALIELENDNISSLIIDVRDNGGGYLLSVEGILENFLTGEKPYIYLLNVKKNIIMPSYPKAGTVKKPYPIYVLVNQNSASASEILAGTLQKNKYKIIGETTYGKDVYQVSYPMPTPLFPENTYLNYTQGYWQFADGTTAKGGIKPDIYMKDTGVKTLYYPVLFEEYKLGDSSPYISVYQYLISRTTNQVYEPGLFDQVFQDMVNTYQQENGLPETGILDEATLKHLIIFYRNMMRDSNNDNLLNSAIEYARNAIDSDQ